IGEFENVDSRSAVPNKRSKARSVSYVIAVEGTFMKFLAHGPRVPTVNGTAMSGGGTMTGSKYSAVGQSIAKLLAYRIGRAALDFNNYNSGTPIVNVQLRMAKKTPIESSNEAAPSSECRRQTVTVDPKTIVGMLFTMLARDKQLGV